MVRLFGTSAFTEFKKEQTKKNLELELAIQKIQATLDLVLDSVKDNSPAAHAAVIETKNQLLQTAEKLVNDHYERMNQIKSMHEATVQAILDLHTKKDQEMTEYRQQEHEHELTIEKSKEAEEVLMQMEAKARKNTLDADPMNTLTSEPQEVAGETGKSVLNGQSSKSPYFVNIHM